MINKATKCLHHIVGSGRLSLLGGPGRTPCGWVYSTATGEVLREPPTSITAERICSRCLPELREQRSGEASDSEPDA